MSECRRVEYSGRVQGVGFRATVVRLARGRPVRGYVKNLAGGNVELVVEGEMPDVQAFLGSVDQAMAGYVDKSQVDKVPAQGFADFRIAY